MALARRILVTAALPYANGQIHLGHMVEHVQTDIWVRFQKLRGHHCIFICADDTHGTAIMIRARQEGRSEEALIAAMRAEHLRDFAGFEIGFDHYGSTHSPENRELCGQIWAKLRAQGLIASRGVSQLYDPVAGTFLADRFVKGTCPKCQSPDQYGDSCEKCGANYSPADLLHPRSTLSGATPETRTADHEFIQLEKLHDFLEAWTQSGEHLQDEVANYLRGHFLGEPLRDWDVSRPAPYFGFEIPDSPGNFWYVWFDAPVGYIASTWEWCQKQNPPQSLDTWWRDPATEIHHFIGKDITYFHTLFWPGMLKSAELNLPAKVHIHGFLTVGGEKMSKSRGTFVNAKTYLEFLDPAYLRYFYASKLGPRLDDLDLQPAEFVDKVNSDLVGKVVNLASRTARFVQATGLAPRYPDDGGLFAQAAAAGDEIAAAYEACDYSRAMRKIMELADKANLYVESTAPWTLKKDPANAGKLQEVCTVALNLFRQVVVYLTPVLPKLARQVGELLHRPIVHWDETRTPLVGTPVAPFVPLLARVDPDKLQAMFEASKEKPIMSEPPPAASSALPGASQPPAETALPTPIVDGPECLLAEPLTETLISIDDFTKVDLRVARVLTAEEIPEAKKLLKLTVSLGGDVRRTVFAGIKAAYKPEQLVGRLVIIAANLAPRTMKFGTSEGMVLAVGGGGAEVFCLHVDDGGKPGMRVH